MIQRLEAKASPVHFPGLAVIFWRHLCKLVREFHHVLAAKRPQLGKLTNERPARWVIERVVSGVGGLLREATLFRS